MKNGARRTWRLRLYVAGQTPKSIAALGNLKRLCEEHLAGRYRIEIVVIPTLVRQLPQPIRKIIGDLSNQQKVLVGLDVLAGEPEV